MSTASQHKPVDTRPEKIIKLEKKMRRKEGGKKLNRSMAGNTLLFIIMGISGLFMVLPLVMIVNNALKPLDEIYQFPPRIFVRNPTLTNFSDLFVLMNESWVPFSRYIFNTIIISLGGMLGHVIVASMAAYPLAKHKFPGKALLFSMVVLSMMFSWTVTQIPQYLIISWLGINNTYAALVLPMVAAATKLAGLAALLPLTLGLTMLVLACAYVTNVPVKRPGVKVILVLAAVAAVCAVYVALPLGA